MKTLFLSITTPIIIRNLFLIPGGVLAELKKEKDLRIVILVIREAYFEVKKNFEDTNIIVEPVSVNWKKTHLQKAGTFFTTYLNYTPLARLEATMGVRIDRPASGGRKYLNPLKSFISVTFGKSFFIRTKIAPFLDYHLYEQPEYEKLFKKYKPDAVFVPDIFGLSGRNILREAKKQGVRSIGMTASWDHFPKRFEPQKPDTLLVWSDVLKNEAIDMQSYRESNATVVGVPQYDLFTQRNLILSREEFCKLFGFNPNKKIISFFSSSKRAPDDGDIANMLIGWINSGELSKDSQLFIRPYPGVQIDHEKFDKFDGEKNTYIDWVPTRKIFGDAAHGWYPEFDSMVQMMNVFYHSDIIINTYSSASVEASIFLTPAININFDGYKNRPFEQSVKRGKYKSHFNHVFETGGVHQAEDADDLFGAINKFLENPKANVTNQKKLRDKMCHKIDGKSSERIAQQILEALETKE